DALLSKKQFYLSRVAQDEVAGKDVRLYDMRTWFQTVFEALLSDKWVSTWRVATWRLQTRLIGTLTLLLRDGLAYAYLIVLAIRGQMSLADFTLYFGAITGFSAWVTDILTQYNRLLEGNRKVCDLRAYLEMPDTPLPADPLPPPPLDTPPSIVFEDVSFGYEPGKPVLDHVSFCIEAGQRLALVGVNGAGKTTLVKLLCGFYKPWSGRILLGGADIARIPREQLYTAYSAVFQEFPIFPFSLAENVGMTTGDALDKQRVCDCLDAAGLGDFVRSLPQGVEESMLKVYDEDGVVLSGGQQQKLILARALYKAAPVLLLDEPTAALDPIAESALYEAYAAFTRDRTALYISHRLASTRFCDRVILLESGRILEEGTHEALLKAGGAYAKMFETQSRYYRDHPEGGEAHEAV
ncbi:MAG TPA: ABC transporter ATP-binding protein, partial [Clostridia bacterium]|nr:ABC transporter ATP-binding protein [Clostridia bacterium]